MNHGRDLRILLVEDNPDDVELTLRAFEQAGMANPVTVAEDGVRALELALPPIGPGLAPDLILLDLKLPRLNGMEVLRALRADRRTELIPVVVLTTSNEERDLIESYQLGANSYVRKPVEFGEFAAAIKQLGLYWLVINNPPPQRERRT